MALKTFYLEDGLEAGIDEAGRGCYAGPVFAAAVILPKDFYHPLLNDSKQVKEQDRQTLRLFIEAQAICYSVSSTPVAVIDKVNILQATYLAMHQALDNLSIVPDRLLVDGNRFIKWQQVPHHCIIKGDSTYMSVAAASILAKTYRDEHMQQLHESFPQYGWLQNKGYGTAAHREAISLHGLCIHHRKSFNIAPIQMQLNF